MKIALATLVGTLWWGCLALVVIGEAQALLIILATFALFVFVWGEVGPND